MRERKADALVPCSNDEVFARCVGAQRRCSMRPASQRQGWPLVVWLNTCRFHQFLPLAWWLFICKTLPRPSVRSGISYIFKIHKDTTISVYRGRFFLSLCLVDWAGDALKSRACVETKQKASHAWCVSTKHSSGTALLQFDVCKEPKDSIKRSKIITTVSEPQKQWLELPCALWWVLSFSLSLFLPPALGSRSWLSEATVHAVFLTPSWLLVSRLRVDTVFSVRFPGLALLFSRVTKGTCRPRVRIFDMVCLWSMKEGMIH